MASQLRLLAVLAHPDDESLAAGGALARYAAEGVEVHLVTATRGERGRYFDDRERPPDQEVGRVREAELRAAAAELGIQEVNLLGYLDGQVDSADPAEAIGRIVAHVRDFRPQVVITFDPFGAYGHPDHIAISQLTAAGVAASVDPGYASSGAPPHRVSKLYYLVEDARSWALFERAFKRLVSRVDGAERVATAWPEWAITTRIDAGEHWRSAWRAIRRHQTQIAIYSGLDDLSDDQLAEMWGTKSFYRVFSLINGGREVETDLFEGLR